MTGFRWFQMVAGISGGFRSFLVLVSTSVKKIIFEVLRDLTPPASLQNVKCTCRGMLFFSKVAVFYFKLD